jgi:hypothetical protein
LLTNAGGREGGRERDNSGVRMKKKQKKKKKKKRGIT